MRHSTSSALSIGLTLLFATTAVTAAQETSNTADSTDKSAQPEPAKAPDPVAEGHDSTFTADFSLLEEYRLRIASSALPATGNLGEPLRTNQQTDQHLRLLGDGLISGYDDHFRAMVSGAFWYDLDGASQPGTGSLFATQTDYANPWVTAYTVSAEWRKQGALDHVRVGRQASEHGMPLTFDGASLGIRVLDRRLLLFGFGGRTVHFFETKPNLFENWVGSAGAVLRPTDWSALEFDARIIQEQVLNNTFARRDTLTNHTYGLSASARSDSLYSKVYLRGIGNVVSHIGGAFQFQDEQLRLGLDGRINAQLVTMGEVVESENPLYSLLGPSLPYARLRFEGWKDFRVGEQANLGLHLGWRARQLIGNAEQPFNRNSGAVYFHTRLDDVIEKGLFVGATVEANYVPRSLSREYLLTLGGSAGYRGSSVKTEVGTYYQQFKINYYQQAEEIHNARTIFGSIAYRLASWLELRARYDFDIFDRYLQSFFFSAREDF